MATPAELPEQLARRVTSWKTLALAAGLLLAAGAALALYPLKFARADQFEEHVRASEARFNADEKKIGEHDVLLKFIHDDLEDIRDQDAANARAVGAPVVPRRSH